MPTIFTVFHCELKWVCETFKSLDSVLIYVFTTSQLFWYWGCKYLLKSIQI